MNDKYLNPTENYRCDECGHFRVPVEEHLAVCPRCEKETKYTVFPPGMVLRGNPLGKELFLDTSERNFRWKDYSIGDVSKVVPASPEYLELIRKQVEDSAVKLHNEMEKELYPPLAPGEVITIPPPPPWYRVVYFKIGRAWWQIRYQFCCWVMNDDIYPEDPNRYY